MNVGSLFAGIGGFELGLERAGFEIEWQVELDPYCRAILDERFPYARRFEDVREVGAATLEPVDLICGGFPCQDLSSAGKGAGIDGSRSGLWSEFARIVRELRPRYVLVENVPGLLTGKGKRWDRAPIGRVLGDLAEIGYDAEWSVLSAREFGAPHLRKRVWIVAYPGEGADADPRRLEVGAQLDGAPSSGRKTGSRREHADRLRDALPDTERDRTGHLEVRRDRRQGRQTTDPSEPALLRQEHREGRPENAGAHSAGLADADGPGREEQRCARPAPSANAALERASPWEVEPDVGRVAHGVPDRVDRLAALGNALVPQIAEWIGQRILEWEAASVSATPAGPSDRRRFHADPREARRSAARPAGER